MSVKLAAARTGRARAPGAVRRGGLASRLVRLYLGLAAFGVSLALMVRARLGLGPGPRDGLMTGIAARGHSLRVVRTLIELSVLAIGFALGGTVGVGTVAYALSIGPLTHVLLPRLTVTEQPRRERSAQP